MIVFRFGSHTWQTGCPQRTCSAMTLQMPLSAVLYCQSLGINITRGLKNRCGKPLMLILLFHRNIPNNEDGILYLCRAAAPYQPLDIAENCCLRGLFLMREQPAYSLL